MSRSLKQKSKTYDKGLYAEKVANAWLRLKGYKILETRYKTKYGEIDLIAQKDNMIAFVEVKARPDVAQGLESVTPKAQGRITNSASYYISQKNLTQNEFRFDVLVVLPSKFGVPQIHHLDNAW